MLDELPTSRAAIFRLMKSEGPVSIPRIAAILGITHEAARKHVVELERNGWIGSDCAPEEELPAVAAPGRPPVRYCLTAKGDHLFPKKYQDMVIRLIDTIVAECGADAAKALLTRITDDRVAALEPRPNAKSTKQMMAAMRALYGEDDPFIEVERRGANYVVIERNCPYLNVALARPAICSTSVSTLRRLTGCEVVRERRFQDGDGRCEFHVLAAGASPKRKQVRFEIEPPRTSGNPAEVRMEKRRR